MRIKKNENWRLRNTRKSDFAHPNISHLRVSFDSIYNSKEDRKSLERSSQLTQQRIFSDPRNKLASMNFRNYRSSYSKAKFDKNKKGLEPTPRQEQIKKKIKERIINEYETDILPRNESRSFLLAARLNQDEQSQENKHLVGQSQFDSTPRAGVFIKGNSVSLNSLRMSSEKADQTKQEMLQKFRASRSFQVRSSQKRKCSNLSSSLAMSTELERINKTAYGKRGRPGFASDRLSQSKQIEPWGMETSLPFFQL